ncbi:hypothetical protein [Flavobacterium hercynium]|uniref:Uncharacterized protein n=1 Tax=Flavobacterium hercynium TaxID=387094 RepID=A0A226GX73_9FLAO|nr:hypothetical protein [Flavobacterium hercynium]OXA85890.1 hypothetical protein B0A66_18705 [Flavobacterium hercynium]PAM94568.1 hypothetical protein B4N84_11345 [Flavobacterium sp. IR1]SMP33726.1 hypothetical protein SAMN06265346_11727 [Flavobacterium hercynium]
MVPKSFFLPEFNLDPVLNKKEIYRFETITTDFTNRKQIKEKSIIREVRLTYYGKRKELFVFVLFTRKVTILLNQKVENNRLLKEDIFAFGNLEIGVNEAGEIVKVFNIKELQERWIRKKLELREGNAGYVFDAFLNDISNVLNSEERTLFFLNSKNMFGLYFHGLFGENDVNSAPNKRIVTIMEFDDVQITEEIWTDNRIPGFIIQGQRSDDEYKTIISNVDNIKKYTGELIYNRENQLQEGFLEIENNNINIKHNVVWAG